MMFDYGTIDGFPSYLGGMPQILLQKQIYIYIQFVMEQFLCWFQWNKNKVP